MEQSHKLSLKVLRLSKSVLAKQSDIITDEEDQGFITTTVPVPLLTLPASFGTIFAGECFRFIVSVNIANNEVDDQLYEAWLNCVVQTPSNQSITLLKAAETKFQVGSSSSQEQRTKEFIVSHEALEVGAYTLVVGVNYRRKEEEAEFGFKKIYKFNTVPGISVKAGFSPLGGSSSNVLVQAQVNNLTESTLVLETLQLDAPEGWQLVSGPSSTVYASSLVNPKDIWQFVYILATDMTVPRNLSDTKFTVSWRREPMGEKGWLTIDHLMR